jgi:DNA processing protein
VPSRRFVLALAALPGVGRRRLRTLVRAAAESRAGHAVHGPAAIADFLRGPGAGARLPAIAPATCAAAWDAAGAVSDTCERRGWTLWVLGTPSYPAPLLDLADPPALLFVDGVARFDGPARLAIVGTREPSPWGEAAATAFAREAVRLGAVVVSGLAWGIDTAAHRATVDAGGLTWAVLPGSLDIIFPGSNRALAERIVAAGGALISEYPPATRPQPTFFVERDRLQAALGQATVVIETGPTGGTMHTARFARELQRPIRVAWPPDVTYEAAAHVPSYPEPQQGVAVLREQGAEPIEPDALAAWLRLDPSAPADPDGGQRRLFE